MPSSGTRVPGKSREPPATEQGPPGAGHAASAHHGGVRGHGSLALGHLGGSGRVALVLSLLPAPGRLLLLLESKRWAFADARARPGPSCTARGAPPAQVGKPRHSGARECSAPSPRQPLGRRAARPSFPSRGRRALPHRHTERGLCPRADAAAGLGSRQHPGGPAAAGLWAQVPGYGGKDTGLRVAGAGRLTGLSCTRTCLSLQKERKALGETYGTNGQRPRGRSGKGVSTGRNAGTRRPAQSGPRLAPRCGGGRSALGWRLRPGQHEGRSPPFSTNAHVTKAHFRDPLNPLPKRA